MSFKTLTTTELIELSKPYTRGAYACLRLVGRRALSGGGAPQWAIREPSGKPYLVLYFGDDPAGPGSIGAQSDGPYIVALKDIALWDSPGVVPELLGPLPEGAAEGLRAAMVADVIEELAEVATNLTPADWINGLTPMMRRWRDIRADSRELVQKGLRVFTPAGDVEAAVLRRDLRAVEANRRVTEGLLLQPPVQPGPGRLIDASYSDLCVLATTAARSVSEAEAQGVDVASIVREVFSGGDK